MSTAHAAVAVNTNIVAHSKAVATPLQMRRPTHTQVSRPDCTISAGKRRRDQSS